MLEEAPVYTVDVPEVEYEDFWITPERIVFMGRGTKLYPRSINLISVAVENNSEGI